MRAIILAAGRGRRLQDANPGGRPKCLLQIGGQSLLQRQLRVLHQNGVNQADLVIGHEADQIIEHVATLAERPDVAFHYNPRHDLGSVLSLGSAAAALSSGTDVLVMDADVLFHPAILDAMVRSEHANCFLLDRNFLPGDEPVKIAVKNGRMVEFRKALPSALSYDTIGESVGFFRFDPACAADILARCQAYESEGLLDAPHEEVLRDLLLASPERFDFVDVSGQAWVEVDFAEDVKRAEQDILPAIRADYPDY